MNSSTIAQAHLHTVLENLDILLELLFLLEPIKAIEKQSADEIIKVYQSEADSYLNGIRDYVIKAIVDMRDADVLIDNQEV